MKPRNFLLRGNEISAAGFQKLRKTLSPSFYQIGTSQGVLSHPRWIVGGVQRGTSKCFMITVKDRTAETLLPFIQKYILPIQP